MTESATHYRDAWRSAIYDATGDYVKTQRAMELAELNGLFDPVDALARPAPITQCDAESDYVLVPRELTAANGAKAALIGEFSETFDYIDDEGDESQAQIGVSWTTIKAIHKKMVAILALSLDPGTVAVASGPTAEDIRACAWSTLIGWQHELGDSIDFICDQIARKATMPAVSSTHHRTPAE